MCECGCTSNDRRYSFPGPRKSFYILTLSGGCVDCDAPSGVTIERINPGDFMYDRANREDFLDGKLPFEKWPGSEGVAIITGLRRHEFVKALQIHLVGTEIIEDGTIDEIGAEVLLEEAYEDSVVTPHFPVALIPDATRQGGDDA